MGSSVKRSRKGWTARWRDVNGVGRWKAGFATKKDADDYWKDQEAKVRKGKSGNRLELNITLYDYVMDEWRQTLDVRKSTKEDYQRALRSHIIPQFGETGINDIKPNDIKAFAVMLKEDKHLAPRTVEKILNLLAQILKTAVDNEYLSRSPFDKLKRTKAQKLNKPVPLTLEQVRAIANELPEVYRLMVWIGYWTAMRPSEILGLTWEQLNFDEESIVIDRQLSRDTSLVHEPKGLKTKASARTIGFPVTLRKLIAEHIEKFGLGPHGLLLQNRLGGVLRYPDAARLFRNAARSAGVPLVEGQNMHQLRHTCVSTLVSIGISPKEIQEWVGHKSIVETMDTYGHLFPDATGKIAARLDSFAKEHEQYEKVELISINGL